MSVGVPAVPLLTPPASVTSPVASPVITAASFWAWMVMVTSARCRRRSARERIGQRRRAVERLHRRIVVVERVGPHAGRSQLVGAVAVDAGCAGRTAVQASAGLSTSSESRLPVSVGVPGVPLVTPPASVTSPAESPVMVASSFCGVDGDGDELRGAVYGRHVERIGQRRRAVERLHRRLVVVERVGPDPGRRHREGAVARDRGGPAATAFHESAVLSTSASRGRRWTSTSRPCRCGPLRPPSHCR